MVRILSLCAVLLTTQPASGQMLDNRCGKALEGEFCFDREFMRVNHIDSVQITFQKKVTGKKLWQSNDILRMAFDPEGRLREFFRTKAAGNIVDTTHLLFTFGELEHWKKKQEKDQRGYFIESPEFDNHGRVRSTTYYKAPCPQELRDDNPVTGTRINQETFEYDLTAERELTTIRNNYDLPYRQIEVKKDPSGYLIEEAETFTVTRRTRKRAYDYSENGWVSSVKLSDTFRKHEVEKRYSYDAVGNLVQMQVWESGKHTHTWEVVYDDLGRIDGIIIVQVSNNSMDIWNFSYPRQS